MREGLLHHKSLLKDVRVFVIEGLVACGMLNVQAGSFDKVSPNSSLRPSPSSPLPPSLPSLSFKPKPNSPTVPLSPSLLPLHARSFAPLLQIHYQPQMDHTSWVLSKLGNFDPEVHFPVQISDLAAFERLCKAIQSDEVGRGPAAEGQTICDTIEVFVGCTEVSLLTTTRGRVFLSRELATFTALPLVSHFLSIEIDSLPRYHPLSPFLQTYSITHQHRPIRDQLEDLSLTIAHALEMGFQVRANLAVTIECPYEGTVPPERVADIADEMVKMGCYEVCLDDTTGRGDPGTVGRLVREVGGRIGIEKVACRVSRFSLSFCCGLSGVREGRRGGRDEERGETRDERVVPSRSLVPRSSPSF